MASEEDDPYADLVSAWLRGVGRGSSGREVRSRPRVVPIYELQEVYWVRLGPWHEMVGELLVQIAADAGSIRKAAVAIGMPRSTMSAKLRRYQREG